LKSERRRRAWIETIDFEQTTFHRKIGKLHNINQLKQNETLDPTINQSICEELPTNTHRGQPKQHHQPEKVKRKEKIKEEHAITSNQSVSSLPLMPNRQKDG